MTDLSSSNIDQWLFDYFEGNLSPLQEQKVEMFLFEHPDYEVDMDAWSNASASSSIDSYPDAEKLKRKRAGFIFWMRSAAALLLVLILVGAYFLIQPMNNSDENQVSANNLFLQTINNLAIASTERNNTFLQNNNLYANSAGVSSKNNLSAQNNSTNQNHTTQNIQNKHTKPVLLAHQSTNQSLSNSSNGWRNTEKLTTATSKSSLENPENGFSKDVLMIDASLVEPPIQVKNTDIVESALLAPKSDLSASKSEEKTKTNHWFSKISRKIKDMANSELALRNLRDPQYIIPGMTQRDVNFASTGGLLATRVQTFSRAQWVGKNDQSVDIRMAADGYVQSLHGGVGIQVGYSNYKAGLLQNYEAALTYSPKFRLGNNFTLEPAVRFKMGIKDLNNNRVVAGQQSEWDRVNVNTFSSVGQQNNMSRLWYKDIGFGLMVNAKWFFAGVNMDNLTRHSENLYSGDTQNSARTPFNFTATLGTDYESMSKKVALSSYLVYQNYGKRNEGWLGLTFRYQWLTVGGALSTGLDPAASIGLKFNHFMLTYSMDYSKNHIQNDRYLSYQLSLRFVTKQTQYGRKFMH